MFLLFAFSFGSIKTFFSEIYTKHLFFIPFFFFGYLRYSISKLTQISSIIKRKFISKSTTFIMKKSIESEESIFITFIIKLFTSAVH